MTAAAEPTSDTTTTSSFTVRLHAWLAVVFFVVGLAGLLAAYAGIASPTWLEGSSLAEYLTYGRSLPFALNALLFGWVTLGLLAGIYFFAPRVVGRPLAYPGAAPIGAVLIAAGVGSGLGAIISGGSAGGRFLEMPWFSDVLVLAGFLIAAVSIGATVARSERPTGVPAWYLLAAPWWLFFSYASGAVPGLTGVDAELQSAFVSAAVFGMWVVPAAIGLGYALIAQQVPTAEFHPRLGRIGFWSLGLLWAWTAARTLQYGPTPDWFETIPVLFSIGLIVAALVVVTDYAMALSGSFSLVDRSTSLGTFAIGTGIFLLLPGHMLIQSLRGPSSIVRFTGWEAAFDLLAILGAFTFWTAAVVGHAVAPHAFRRLGGTIGRWAMLVGLLFAVGTRWVAGLQQGYTWLGGAETGLHSNVGDGFRNTVEVLTGTDALTFIGLAIYSVGALLIVAGLWLPRIDGPAEGARGPVWLLAAGIGLLIIGTGLPTGLTAILTFSGLALLAVGLVVYLAAPLIQRRSGSKPEVPTEEEPSTERRWAVGLITAGLAAFAAGTALPIGLTLPLTVGGIALAAAGFVVLGGARDRAIGSPDPIEFDWPDREETGTIRRGVVGLFALAVLAVFVLPAWDSDPEPTLLADRSRRLAADSVEERGLEVYISEGCWYCHTQQVRAVVTDLGLGPVSVAGDYVYDPVGTLGVARIGPDLMHVGSRQPTDDAGWVADHLADPRAVRPWSTKPSYGHLSDADLAAVAAYVAGLE